MRSARAALAAAVVVSMLTLAGCGSSDLPDPPPVPTGPTGTPSRSPVSAPAATMTAMASPTVRESTADDLGLTGVRACPLLTPATFAAAGLATASAVAGLPTTDGATSTCVAQVPDGRSITVDVVPSTSLEAWQEQASGAAPGRLAGFPAATAIRTVVGAEPYCRVAVGTAPTAVLVFGQFIEPATVADPDACTGVLPLAEAVIATQRAMR